MLLPYGIQTVKRADIPRIKLANLYVEKQESVPGNVILMPRPALVFNNTLGAGPNRGIACQDGSLNNDIFTVSGGTLYNNLSAIGSIGGTGNVAMSFADNSLLIANGVELYRTDGALVTQIAFPDGAGVQDVSYLGGYALAARAGSRRIYFTLDTTTWDGLDFVSAELSTGAIVGFSIVSGQLWVFCTDHTELFYLTGDSDAPIVSAQVRSFDKGALTRESITKLDNTVFWVGHDGIVYRGGDTPIRVSDHGIEERIAESNAADIAAMSYPWNGHLFYVLHLTNGTVCYDPATQQWHELESYGRTRWRAVNAILFGRTVVTGDDENGTQWLLQDGLYTDDGTPISRIFTLQINDNTFVDNLAFDCSVGQVADQNSPAGLIELRTSRDGGETWGNWKQASLGKLGHARTYARWRRLGLVDEGNMLIQVRITDPVASRISYCRVNEATSGRSR